jgi:hypothetical protein
MSRAADRFASNPIVVAKAIARAVAARRAAARYVAPRRTNLVFVLSALLPTSIWDWAMRKVGRLTPATLELSSVPTTVPAAPPATKPATEARANAN